MGIVSPLTNQCARITCVCPVIQLQIVDNLIITNARVEYACNVLLIMTVLIPSSLNVALENVTIVVLMQIVKGFLQHSIVTKHLGIVFPLYVIQISIVLKHQKQNVMLTPSNVHSACKIVTVVTFKGRVNALVVHVLLSVL